MMPSTTTRRNFVSSNPERLEHSSKAMEILLEENGFHSNGKSTIGCYYKKVASANVDLPMLIRDIFPQNTEEYIWILGKGIKTKRVTTDEKENDMENAINLANLGKFGWSFEK
jgi:hypothetical protein